MSQNGETNADNKSLEYLSIPEEARRTGSSGGKKIWIGIACVATVLVIILVIVSLFKPPMITTAQAIASRGGGSTILDASGYVTPRRSATVAAKITGRVESVLVEEGDIVEEGDVLARLDDSDARARYNATKAQLSVAKAAVPDIEASFEQAERDLKRNKALLGKGFISEQEVDRAETAVKNFKSRLVQADENVKAAAANVKIASRDLENCIIRAPFSGVVVSKDAQPGEMVSPISAGSGYTRTGIATIVDMTSLEIEVDVNEAYIARVKPGQPVDATLDAYPEWHIPASVLTVIPTADRQKATVRVRISFKQLDPRILPDMGVKVRFLNEESDRKKAEILVPEEAIRQEGQEQVVYVVKSNKVERRAVKTGNITPEGMEVMSGLFAGEQVMIDGPEKIKDGQRVRVSSGGK